MTKPRPKVRRVPKAPEPSEPIKQPPPEDELGGGDICSVEEQPSTDDDKPLE